MPLGVRDKVGVVAMGGCELCGSQKNLLRCSRCKLAHYCSKEHQRLHWKEHKSTCKREGVGLNGNIQSSSAKPNCQNEVLGYCPSVVCRDPTQLHLSGKSTIVAGDGGCRSGESRDRDILNPEIGNPPHLLKTDVTSGTYATQGGFVADTSLEMLLQDGAAGSAHQAISSWESRLSSEYQNLSTTGSEGVGRVLPPAEADTRSGLSVMGGNIVSDLSNALNHYPESSPRVQLGGSEPVSQCERSHGEELTVRSPPPYLHRNVKMVPTEMPTTNSHWMQTMCQYVIRDMDRYGICVIDNFVGQTLGNAIQEEVTAMYGSGLFVDGKLMSNPSGNSSKTIRGDKILWVNGHEKFSTNIGYLIKLVDAVVCNSNRMPGNGKLGEYVISDRTKAMVACYPGNGTQYVKHVDNPNKDGRCITCIYYLNKDWDVARDGGLLRIFPKDWKMKVADIEPLFDRILFFWSDRRNPHEVQPSRRTRYAITLWYNDKSEKEAALRQSREPHRMDTVKQNQQRISSH